MLLGRIDWVCTGDRGSLDDGAVKVGFVWYSYLILMEFVRNPSTQSWSNVLRYSFLGSTSSACATLHELKDMHVMKLEGGLTLFLLKEKY